MKFFLFAFLLLGSFACGDDGDDCKCDKPAAETPAPAPTPEPAPAPAPAPAPEPGKPPFPFPLPPDLPIPIPPDLPIPIPSPGNPDDPGYPQPAPEPPGEQPAVLGELVDTINQERAQRDIPSAVQDRILACAAAKHAADVGQRRACSHTGSDGSSFSSRVIDCGGVIRSGGEIIACGQGTPREAVTAWLNSPGHRMIMLDGSYRRLGAGMSNNFWVVVFAGE